MATVTETNTGMELHELPSPQPSPPSPPSSLKAKSKSRKSRILSAGFSFFVAGINDGSIGALLPYMLRQYEISNAIVSAIYAANFFGWLVTALVNTHLSQYLDLGVLLALGAILQIAAQALRAWGPPFGLFVVTFFLVSLGQAFQDTHANTFVAGSGARSHRWLAFIHAMYMAGCLVGPFLSTAIAATGTPEQPRWFYYYAFPMGLGLINLTWCMVAFRDTLRLKKKVDESQASSDQDNGNGAAKAGDIVKATLKTPSVWLLSAFYFFYLGAVLTASGWVVEYLVAVRHGELDKMGYVPAGFNGGCLLGRVLLAEPTQRLGPRRMVTLYIVLALALQLLFWLVPNIIAASIAVSLVGFFTGPLFAAGMALASKLFPAMIQSNALGLVFVFAQMGGSLFPIVTGVISSSAGVKVLQPILVALLAATAGAWLLVPRPKEANNELHHE